jgi:hypothetical protein
LNIRSLEERAIAMFFFKKNRNESEYDKKLIKCKECEMKFDHKDRLIIHSKKAHSGRGERKKKV